MSKPNTPGMRWSIPVGTKFWLYGWASDGLTIKCTRTLRERVDGGRGSRILGYEPIGTTFPLTEKGAKAADAWSLRMNEEEAAKHAVEIPL